MKTIETDMEYTKTNVEYMRKVIQQHKFFGGCPGCGSYSTSTAVGSGGASQGIPQTSPLGGTDISTTFVTTTLDG